MSTAETPNGRAPAVRQSASTTSGVELEGRQRWHPHARGTKFSQLENRVTTRTGFLAAAQQAAQDIWQDAGILMGTGGTNEMSCGDFLGDGHGRAV